VHFRTDDWYVERTINVYAVQDNVVDGNDTQAFADQPELLSRIRGPLTVEGGFGGQADPVLGDPVMLPFETNQRVPDGALDGATTTTTNTTLTDNEAPWLP